VAWSTCPACAASYRNDEDLRECPRCKHAIAGAVAIPSLILPSATPQTRPVTRRLFSAWRVFCLAALVLILTLLAFGVVLMENHVLVSVGGLLIGPFEWPLVGAGAGLVLALPIGLLALWSAPRETTQETVLVALTPEGISPFLTQMGYPHDTRRMPTGEPECEMKVTRDGWSVSVVVNLSPNRANLWLTIVLRSLPTDHHRYGPQFVRLLQASWDVAPAFFATHRTNNVLCLMRAIENRSLTPVVVRQILDDMIDACRRTFAWWDVAGWMVLPGEADAGGRDEGRSESQEIYRPNRDIRE